MSLSLVTPGRSAQTVTPLLSSKMSTAGSSVTLGVGLSSWRFATALWSRSTTWVVSLMAFSSHYWTVIARGLEDSRLPMLIDRQPLA